MFATPGALSVRTDASALPLHVASRLSPASACPSKRSALQTARTRFLAGATSNSCKLQPSAAARNHPRQLRSPARELVAPCAVSAGTPAQQDFDAARIVVEAEEALQDKFHEVDLLVKKNLRKVLAAFRKHRVGAHHFASVSGYGHGDIGRDVLDEVFADAMGAEAAAVRVQMVSGTHAIACALYGVLRPGDEMLAVAGAPYDTLEEVIGLRSEPGHGSLAELGVSYRQVELKDGAVDWEALSMAVGPKTRLVHIQRSCGYSWRRSLSVDEIGRIIASVKAQNPDVVCFVDNCYGEFIEDKEPTSVGADLMAGSMIKNPGGTIATAGGYVAGRRDLVEAACCRLTAPGIGSEGGATFDQNRLLYQGLFLAPQMVGEAMKSTYLIGYAFDSIGYPVNPPRLAPRRDVIQAVQLGSPEKMIAVCRALQQHSPIGSYLDPIPSETPGYESLLIMAGGTFIEGSTLEFSADGPLREPYTLFCQGGTHWGHISIALQAALESCGPPDTK